VATEYAIWGWNWGRSKEWEMSLLPWEKPRANTESCANKKYWLKGGRNEDEDLFYELFKGSFNSPFSG
jgi:hypothetical protein